MNAVKSQVTPDTQNLKVRLVEVAMNLLVEPREMRLPTMREIALSAGVTPGAAYRHFESQEELFFAVIAELFGRLEQDLMTAIQKETDPAKMLKKIAHAYIDWGLSNKGGYQLLFETTDDDNLMATGKRPGLHLIEHIASLISNNLKPTQDELARVTQLWVYMHGIVSLRTHKTGMPWATSVDKDVDRLLETIFGV